MVDLSGSRITLDILTIDVEGIHEVFTQELLGGSIYVGNVGVVHLTSAFYSNGHYHVNYA